MLALPILIMGITDSLDLEDSRTAVTGIQWFYSL